MSEMCLIGAVTAAHGIHGAVRVRSHSDIPGRFNRLTSVHVGHAGKELRVLHIGHAEETPDRVILHFEDCDNRSTAESLVGVEIYIPVEEMESPPPGRYFIHDIIGCEVLNTSGERKGSVRDVLLLPANDVYVVDTGQSEVLLPAVPAFIHSVDVDAKRIVIEDVPGLFEDVDED